jgi:hypothetical protein
VIIEKQLPQKGLSGFGLLRSSTGQHQHNLAGLRGKILRRVLVEEEQ